MKHGQMWLDPEFNPLSNYLFISSVLISKLTSILSYSRQLGFSKHLQIHIDQVTKAQKQEDIFSIFTSAAKCQGELT